MERSSSGTATTAFPGPATGTSAVGMPPGAVVVAFDGSVPAREAAHWAAHEVAGSGRPLRLLHALRWPRRELAGLGLPRRRSTSTAPGRPRQPLSRSPSTGVVRRHPALTSRAASSSATRSSCSGRPRPTRTSVRFGFEPAARRGHDVVAVHTWSDIPLAALAGRVDLDRDELAERAVAFLSTHIGEAERRHRDVRVHAVTTAERPAQALLGRAAGASLLVVGRHGRAGSSAPLGSVNHAVAHYARCPVAVVGAD